MRARILNVLELGILILVGSSVLLAQNTGSFGETGVPVNSSQNKQINDQYSEIIVPDEEKKPEGIFPTIFTKVKNVSTTSVFGEDSEAETWEAPEHYEFEHPHYVEHHESHAEYFMDFGFGLMRPRRRGMDFVLSDITNDGVPNGTIRALDYERDLFGELLIGHRFHHSHFDLTANYMYFHTMDRLMFNPPAGGNLYALKTHPGTVNPTTVLATSASADAGFDMDVLDLNLSRKMHVSEAMHLTAYAGGRMAWIDQTQNYSYFNAVTVRDDVREDLYFRGAGIRFGGAADFEVNRKLKIFANSSMSLLAGDFSYRFRESQNQGAVWNADVYEKFQRTVPVLDLEMGMSYHWRQLNVKLGYRISEWVNLIESRSFVDDIHSGKNVRESSNLSMDGFFFQVGVYR